MIGHLIVESRFVPQTCHFDGWFAAVATDCLLKTLRGAVDIRLPLT
jgi:hypothetical protein